VACDGNVKIGTRHGAYQTRRWRSTVSGPDPWVPLPFPVPDLKTMASVLFFLSFLFRCFISVLVLFLLPSCLLHPLDNCFPFFLTSCPEGKTGLTEFFFWGGVGGEVAVALLKSLPFRQEK